MPNPFNAASMAAGYAHARPPVHPRVMELAQPYLAKHGPIGCALDVGCGAGLSTRALSPYAAQVFGLEPAEGMLQWRGSIAPGARFVVGVAEALPFATGQFDLLAAAGSLNFVDLDRFFPEAHRVLKPSGILLVYDYAHGRNFRQQDTLDGWFAAFLQRYPAPVSQARRLSPEILRDLDPRFTLGEHQQFALGITLEPEFYIEYVLTGTNVAAAVRSGVPGEEIRAWCAETLRPVWRGQPREVIFHGYVACLHPVA